VAAKYHFDKRRVVTVRVVTVGHSAGGHLALWLAGRPKLPKTSPLFTANPLPISHVISLGGLPDLDATAHSPDNGCGCDVVVKLVGAGRADPYADTSVPPLFPLGVGQDLVNGREDDIIPGRMATDYVAKATAAGDQVALHLIPNTGHVELIAPESAAWTETKQLIKKALGKKLATVQHSLEFHGENPRRRPVAARSPVQRLHPDAFFGDYKRRRNTYRPMTATNRVRPRRCNAPA
jgi:acetyl esterase/lipase